MATARSGPDLPPPPRPLWRRLALASSRSAVVQLPAVAPEGERIYAIGDVHGRADLLQPLLAHILAAAAEPGAPRVRVVGLGDYIDRGPATREVLDLLVALRRARATACEFLLGNHEESLRSFLAEPALGWTWCGFGGRETLASYGVEAPLRQDDVEGWRATRDALDRALPDSHHALLDELQLKAEAGGYLFVHAGVRPGVPLEAQDREDVLWIRDRFLRHRDVHERMVVHGHTPAREPYADHRRIGVDTGAYATGVLSAVRLEGAGLSWVQAREDEEGAVAVVEAPGRPEFDRDRPSRGRL